MSVCEREMSEFGWGVGGGAARKAAGPALVFNPYISLDRCACVRVCVFVCAGTYFILSCVYSYTA